MMILGIYGSGGLGREVLELAKQINSIEKRWQEILFIDDFRTENIFNGCNVTSFIKLKETCAKEIVEVVIAIGEPNSRANLSRMITDSGYNLAILIHPNVHIPDSTKIGNGVIINNNAYISCDVVIEDNVLILHQSGIGHNCIIGKNSVISGNVALGGNVKIGINSYIALNCCIKENVNLGNDVIVSAGSAVMKDVPDNVIVQGNPARIILRNDLGVFHKK